MILNSWRTFRLPRRLACLLGLLLAAITIVRAERLPIKTYTIADGLARDNVLRIVRDSKGFLWFCTAEGLSRFDGYSFTNYGIEHGLPSRVVYDLLETRGGHYWVATHKGLCRFNPDAATWAGAGSQPKFTFDYQGQEIRGHEISALLEDRAGVIWFGGWNNLYRLDQSQGRWICSRVDLGHPGAGPESKFEIRSLLEDRRGALWINVSDGLYRRNPDGRIERFGATEGVLTRKLSSAMLEDHTGRIWIGAGDGLYQLVPEPKLNAPAVARVYTTQDGLAGNFIRSLFQAADGKLWVGTVSGLSVSLSDAGQGGLRFRSYTKAHGLRGAGVTSMAEDRDGNLWLGTESGGAMKYARNGFATYDRADGLGASRIGTLLINQAGELCAIGGSDNRRIIQRFDGRRFEAVELRLPRGITDWGWGWHQTMFQTGAGEWWMATGQGLARYPPQVRLAQLAQARPRTIYTERDGLAEKEPFRIYEDSRGDVWISTFSHYWDTLTRWDRRTETFHRFTARDGLPQGSAPTAFGEDAAGNIWIGFYHGGLARYAGSRLTMFTVADGLPAGLIRGIYLDHASRLWVATGEGGVARIDDPAAERPPFIAYNTANGLSSNQATAITEDRWGRIYIGTGRGVDRLDPASGHIRHYTTADGLAGNFINVALRDREGALWFGTLEGLSRLIPQPDRPPSPLPVLISSLRIAGALYPISELGVAEVTGLELGASQNRVSIDFFALGLEAGEALRYQYKLEGAGSDWSALGDHRTVTYANLAPGRYRFLVRAVSAGGATSPSPAVVAFKILSPVWQRWWFLSLAALVGEFVGVCLVQVSRRPVDRARTRPHAHRHRPARRHRRQPFTRGDPERSGQTTDRLAQPANTPGADPDRRLGARVGGFDERHRLVGRSAPRRPEERRAPRPAVRRRRARSPGHPVGVHRPARTGADQTHPRTAPPSVLDLQRGAQQHRPPCPLRKRRAQRLGHAPAAAGRDSRRRAWPGLQSAMRAGRQRARGQRTAQYAGAGGRTGRRAGDRFHARTGDPIDADDPAAQIRHKYALGSPGEVR